MNIKITVSGPGGVINYEMEVIRRALESVGVMIEVENEYPWEPDSSFENIEQYLSHRESWNKSKGHFVKLIADHKPWGG